MDAGVLSANLSEEVRRNLAGTAELDMVWHCQSDARFHYLIHIPACYYEETQPVFPLVVIVHGTGRDNTGYWIKAREFADQNHFALMAPVFPGGLFETMDLDSYKLLNCGGIRYDLILLNMIEEMGRRFPGIETEKFCMFGFSGGAQFVNRFLFAHPERVKAASIGAPGRPTYLDFEKDYFWGVRDFRKHFDKDLDLEEVRKVPVELMVGDQHTLYIGESPYGTNRIQRICHLKENLESHGIRVFLDILPGLDHVSGRDVKITYAIQFFLPYL